MGGENVKQAKKFKYTIRICHCIDSACFAPSPPPPPPTHTLFHHLSPSWSQWSCLGNPHIIMLCRICNLPYHPHPRGRHVNNPRMFRPCQHRMFLPLGFMFPAFLACVFSFFILFSWGLVSLLILQVFEQSFNVVGKFNCVIVFLTSIVVYLVGAFFETQI